MLEEGCMESGQKTASILGQLGVGEDFTDPSAQDPVQVQLCWYKDDLRQTCVFAEGGMGPV